MGNGFEELRGGEESGVVVAGEIVRFSLPQPTDKRYYITFEIFLEDSDFELDLGRPGLPDSLDEYLDCFPLAATSHHSQGFFSSLSETTVCGFGVPLHLFLAQKRGKKGNRPLEKPRAPYLRLEVFSLDDSRINRFEGGCWTEVPMVPGRHTLTLAVCRDTGGFWDELKRDLIGCFAPQRNKEQSGRHLSQQILAQNHSASVRVKSGEVLVTFSVASTGRETAEVCRAIHERAVVGERVGRQYKAGVPNDSRTVHP